MHQGSHGMYQNPLPASTARCLKNTESVAKRHAVLSIVEKLDPRSDDIVRAQPVGPRQTLTTTPPVQTLAQQVTEAIIVPLIHAGGKACMQTAQHGGGGRALERHDGADAEEEGLEASLLTTLRFLAGMCLHSVHVLVESRGAVCRPLYSLALPTMAMTLPCGILADLTPDRSCFCIHSISKLRRYTPPMEGPSIRHLLYCAYCMQW